MLPCTRYVFVLFGCALWGVAAANATTSGVVDALGCSVFYHVRLL